DVGLRQVQAQRKAARRLAADLVEIPGAARAQREAAAELVLAQPAFNDHDAVAGQKRRMLHPGFGEERAFDAAAAVFQHDEGLALAALAHRTHLAGHDRRDLLAPAAATAFAVAVATLARGTSGLPQG